MADGTPLNAESLREVLDRLNDVMAEAARLRKEVMRQLGDQRASLQQHLSGARKRKAARKKKR